MKTLIGKKIKLINMVYDHPIPPGTEGKVLKIDGVGLIHVKWKSQRGVKIPIRGLCIDPDVDKFEIIE